MMSDDHGADEDVRTGRGQTPASRPASGWILPVAAQQPEFTPDEPDVADEATGTDKSAEEDEPAGHRKKPRRFSVVTEMVVLFAVALTIALLIKSFIVQPFFIPSGSMENTLLIGDKVLVNKLVYDFRPIGRGDIVVFDGTGSWNAPQQQAAPSNPFSRLYDDTLGKLFHSVSELFGTNPGQTDYIKRVIGIPGDHVRCCNLNGQITVNGVPLSEKLYLFPGAAPSTGQFNIVVPPGRLWVLGDNRAESADSRLHDCSYTDSAGDVTCYAFDRNGTVPESAVIGRAFMIIWPPSRIQILRVPATFGQPGLQHSASAAGGVKATRAQLAAASAVMADGGIRVVPAPSYVPLAGGFSAALFLMTFGWWLPRGLIRRRRARRVTASR